MPSTWKPAGVTPRYLDCGSKTLLIADCPAASKEACTGPNGRHRPDIGTANCRRHRPLGPERTWSERRSATPRTPMCSGPRRPNEPRSALARFIEEEPHDWPELQRRSRHDRDHRIAGARCPDFQRGRHGAFRRVRRRSTSSCRVQRGPQFSAVACQRLERQTWSDLHVVVVAPSHRRQVRRCADSRIPTRESIVYRSRDVAASTMEPVHWLGLRASTPSPLSTTFSCPRSWTS